MQAQRGRLIEDLGEGLIVRHVTPADVDELEQFNREMHADPGEPPDERIGRWTRDLFEQPPPTFTLDDFIVVEDTGSGRIVSSLNLISQTWSYACVPFGVGQVEIVATLLEYRRRGLVRRQFAIVHRWSEARGESVQVVSGIPWYYRQFGYEMCVTHGGGRACPVFMLPPRGDESEPFRLRPARITDVTFLKRVADHAAGRYLLTCVRGDASWRYEISGHRHGSQSHFEIAVIERTDGTAVGYVVHRPYLDGSVLRVKGFELEAGVSWTAVTPSVLRALAATAGEYARRVDGGRFELLHFGLESEHPLYQAAPRQLLPLGRMGAWYMRVADLPHFLLHIAPVLEQRLAGSVAAGLSGELRLNFYRSGLRLLFDRGRLHGAEPWPDHAEHAASASFPELTFLQLLFGYRSLEELEYAFPDCYARSEQGRVLLSALFPKQASLVWQIS